MDIYICDFHNYRVRRIDASGIISTFAGLGTPGFSGDNGPASNAQVAPGGIAIDSHNNIYLSDTTGHIRKIDTTGIITSIAGNGSATYSGDGGSATAAGGLSVIEGIAVDDTSNIFVADLQTNKIRKISISGYISHIAGASTGTYSGDGGDALLANFQGPTGLTIAHDGRIYIADAINYRVRCIGCSLHGVGVKDVFNVPNAILAISPNPSSGGLVTFELHQPQTEAMQLSIVNMLGSTIQTVKGFSNREIIMGNELPPGVYSIRATTASGSAIGKMVVQR